MLREERECSRRGRGRVAPSATRYRGLLTKRVRVTVVQRYLKNVLSSLSVLAAVIVACGGGGDLEASFRVPQQAAGLPDRPERVRPVRLWRLGRTELLSLPEMPQA